ncbi:MAG: CPBP family intramembrane metalloprotease [Clostridia bacterium]|nr:CPBP family intramembrane metalloprotease [Clostridia bacterium]
MKKKFSIMALVIFSCAVMGIIDAVIRPGYLIKSFIKLPLFLILPLLYSLFDKEVSLKKILTPTKSGFIKALLVGSSVFLIILLAYFLLKDVFDFSMVTSALTGDVGVTAKNFLWVSLYISFVNSFLEEFFFRGFAFFTLKQKSGRSFAYLFSSLTFALYHISMMIGWFNIGVVLLATVGLFLGGIIFNYFNEKYENIYISYLVHMFANFAINTIGFILFGVI